MTKNSEIRRRAREQLGGSIFASNWLKLLLICAMVVIPSCFAGVPAIGFLFVIAIYGALLYGMTRATTNLAKGQGRIELSDAFKGFTERYLNALMLGVCFTLTVGVGCVLFLVPGIILACMYFMAPFIMQDDPSKSWGQCLRESRLMMKGHKWQFFCLSLSFMGWMILGALCLGVGVFFVLPYMYQSVANFYLALKEQNA